MSATTKQAADWIKRGIAERITELQDAWLTEEDPAEREKLHARARATIELEDHLHARIREYTAE